MLFRSRKRNRPKRAAVLGCGPAGLFAAHALAEAGWDFDIYSNPRKSHMYGAQYLHGPIPGLTHSPASTIKYLLEGTAEGYQKKVYGRMSVPNVSVDVLSDAHDAWDIRETYDRAWGLYGSAVIPYGASFESITSTLQFQPYPLIVSSVPARTLCGQRHQFQAKSVWALGDAPDRGQMLPHAIADNTVICNGTTDIGWYRLSNIFGHKTVEYPNFIKPPLPGIAAVEKPIRHQCTCYASWEQEGRFLRVGRYGRWEKGELSHQAYHRVREVL